MSDEYRLLPEQPPESLDDYLAMGGGVGLANALETDPADVIAEVRAAGLRGRGGAGFPTGIKWGSVAQSKVDEGSPVYLACNAAEGEPGTFKDRVMMRDMPYQIFEGMLIGLHAIGAEAAYIATKARFGPQLESLYRAQRELTDAGWPGMDRVHIVEGPDSYLFGEESAMLEVIEDKLPLPRILPPYQQGLWATTIQANPTAVNNVESISHVTRIMAEGSDAFRAVGTEDTPGTMVFTVIGDVSRPGVYELPMGTSMRTLLCDVAGGDAERIKLIYSGTSNTVITADLLDVPLDFTSMRDVGSGLGSGGLVVYDDSRCVVQVTSELSRFLAIESCGQCNACKLGNSDMFARLERLVRGEGSHADIDTLRERTENVTDQNRCFLPVGAAFLIRSTLELFAEDFEARIGTPSPKDRFVRAPKIVDVDTEQHTYQLDTKYDRKRIDWSYAPADDGADAPWPVAATASGR